MSKRLTDFPAVAWVRRQVPTREALLANRWARPFARHLGHPILWRWNRRSVARGLALGLFFGILIPFIQSPFAALFAVTLRAHLPTAFVGTLVTNPFTTPFIYLAAYAVGTDVLALEASNPIAGAGATMAYFERVLSWLLSASVPTAVGLLVFSTASAVAGYFGVHWVWRWRAMRRWKRRRVRRLREAMA